MSGLESTEQWQFLTALERPRSLDSLFQTGINRSQSMVLHHGQLLVDISRHLIDEEILQALVDLARARGVESAWNRMRNGELINRTENRAVGHIALRCTADEQFIIEGRDVVPEVRATLKRMEDLAFGIRQGSVTGSTGRQIRAIVNIGIGGSNLGPTLMYEALRSFVAPQIVCRFVSNVDPSDLASQLAGLNPEETLVIVASKTFTTAETLANARVARDWLRATVGDVNANEHLYAVSANLEAVRAFGVSSDRFFPMWDWVGGRFSIGSAVGLSAMIALGSEYFHQFLAGQREMDIHAGESFDSTNIPLMMALIGVWNRSVLGFSTRAVVPYAFDLRTLPAYLQQMIMESNGKAVDTAGKHATLPTTPVIWGGVGTDAQHAFMQFIHQSPDVVPVDFIGFAHSMIGDDERQTMLFMNMVAQAEALAHGRPSTETPHKSFTGNRPSTVVVAPALTPYVLGQIIALYEHAVFFEGVILDINSFDQWGVELGKDVARTLLEAPSFGELDTSSETETASRMASMPLVEWFRDHQTSRSETSPYLGSDS